MKLDNSIDPVEENQMELEQSADLDSIVAAYTTMSAPVDEASSDDEDIPPPLPPPSLKQAIEALKTFLRWEEYSEGSRREDIQVLGPRKSFKDHVS